MIRFKKIILMLGDIVLLYGALILTLIFRYGPDNLNESFASHFKPFSLIFIIWILIFYLVDLYELKKLRNGFEIIRNIITATILSVVVSIVLFYLFTDFFKLTPKTNLAIFAMVFAILDSLWRLTIIKFNYAKTKILIIDDSPTTRDAISYLESNPQMGYNIIPWAKEDLKDNNLQDLKSLVINKKIEIIVIPQHFLRENLPVVRFIYQLLPLKIEVINSVDFIEMVFQKAPLEDLGEGWFIEKITTRRKVYDAIKRTFDLILGTLLGIIFLPIMIVNAILIKATSAGPILYKEPRMGKDGKSFTVYKFRSMRANHQGPLWTVENDDRITALGKVLRFTHLDELPQLYNIIKGNISFVGPRPERAELAQKFMELPYYEIRHIIKPGLTGWAQVNYRPSASVEEAFEKLKYDIYYIKNRSLFLDILIVVKTMRLLFKNPE